MRNALAALTLISAVVAAAPASAESTKDRVEVLEQAVSDLQARAPAAAQSSVKINQLEQQIQTLTGQVEQLSYELDQARARLDAVTAALSGETGGDVSASGAGPRPLGGPMDLSSGDPIADRIARTDAAPQPSGDEADVSLPLDPNAAFDYASSFLLRGDYARAQKAFELYLEAYPNQSRSSDARFRLGEIYLATGANADAADTFIKHIQTYPNDPRAAEAYLKLGTAFARMDQSAEACKVFKSMQTKFPNAAPAVRQRADVEMSRINCK